MPAITESRYMVQAGWDDVPHLDEATKRELLNSTPPYLRDARAKGIPSLGSGAVYPVADEDIICQPFEIPAYWRRAYGFDVGWKKTAACWGSEDPVDGTWYIYAEHYRGQAEPVIHAESIKARGGWIPGAIDPAARGRGQRDGEQLIQDYRDLGLNLTPADNAVEAGLYTVWQAFSIGRLKVFSTCMNLLAERRVYRRDENGKIVKEYDHLMDALRYLMMTGRGLARQRPIGESRVLTPIQVLDQRVNY